jgi:hypothetical protein
MGDENKYYVYEWIRLDTNEPFYIGKGKGCRWRVLTRGNNKHFNNIVKSIPVVVNILHSNLNEKTAFEYECYYIWYYRDYIGYNITNINDGGEGNSGYKHSPERIEKIKMNSTGKNNGMWGKHHSEITKNLIVNNREFTDESKRKPREKLYSRIENEKYPRHTEVEIYDKNKILLNSFKTVIKASEWLKNMGYIETINNGRSLINKRNKDGHIYKGLYFKKVS